MGGQIKKFTNINMEESMPHSQIINPCIPKLVKGKTYGKKFDFLYLFTVTLKLSWRL